MRIRARHRPLLPEDLRDAIAGYPGGPVLLIDDQITRKLLEAIEGDPRLKLVPTGTPEIQMIDLPPKEPAKPAA